MADASLKTDYELLKIIKSFCAKKGIHIRQFTDDALREKLERMQN